MSEPHCDRALWHAIGCRDRECDGCRVSFGLLQERWAAQAIEAEGGDAKAGSVRKDESAVANGDASERG